MAYDKEDRLFNQLSDALKEHEMPYEEGEWERFVQLEKRRKLVPFIKAGSVAAAFALLLISFWLWNVPKHETEMKHAAAKGADTPGYTAPSTKINETKPEPADYMHIAATAGKAKPAAALHSLTAVEKNSKGTGSLPAYNPPAANTYKSEPAAIKEKPNEHTEYAGVQDGKQATQGYAELAGYSPAKKTSLLKLGVEFSSSLINDKVGFGAGLFTEIGLSKKISISTGATFARVNAANTLERDNEVTSMAAQKIGVETNISAIDIPLAIVYKVNERVYTSVGVSTMAVLHEDRTYKYEQGMNSLRQESDSRTGQTVFVSEKQTQEFNKKVEKESYKGFGQVGFLNLSIGTRQNLYKKSDLLIEPFLKIPVGPPSQNEIKLLNGGIRMKIAF